MYHAQRTQSSSGKHSLLLQGLVFTYHLFCPNCLAFLVFCFPRSVPSSGRYGVFLRRECGVVDLTKRLLCFTFQGPFVIDERAPADLSRLLWWPAFCQARANPLRLPWEQHICTRHIQRTWSRTCGCDSRCEEDESSYAHSSIVTVHLTTSASPSPNHSPTQS